METFVIDIKTGNRYKKAYEDAAFAALRNLEYADMKKGTYEKDKYHMEDKDGNHIAIESIKRSEHPTQAYILLETEHNTVGIVKYGESGYYKTNWPENYCNEVVREMNENLGLDECEAEVMRILSMNPEGTDWDNRYNTMVTDMISHLSESKCSSK